MTARARTGAAPRLPDRRAAGRQLAAALSGYRDARPVVVGVAADGMPIAAEIARALGAPLEALAIDRLTLGPAADDSFGVAAEGGVALFDPDRRALLEAKPEAVDAVVADTEAQLRQRAAAWHDGARRQSLRGRTVLLVADALADEQLAAAACGVRDRGAANVVYVAPRARQAILPVVEDWVDATVSLELTDAELSPEEDLADATPVADEQIRALLRENRDERRRARRSRTRR